MDFTKYQLGIRNKLNAEQQQNIRCNSNDDSNEIYFYYLFNCLLYGIHTNHTKKKKTQTNDTAYF